MTKINPTHLLLILFCTGIILLVLISLSPFLLPYQTYTEFILSSPTKQFLFGTDELGRDVLSRLIVGTRNSISISLFTVTLALVIGTLLALIKVSSRRILSIFISFICDVFLCIPVLIMCLVIAASFGAGLKVIVIGELLVFIPFVFRIVDKELTHVLQQEYSKVTYRMGIHPFFVATKNGLPFIIPKLQAQAISLCAISIGIEGGLSYFGLGLRLPEPSLGMLLQQSKNYVNIAPLYALSPIFMFFLFLLILSLLSLSYNTDRLSQV